jgi:hypothetical protein
MKKLVIVALAAGAAVLASKKAKSSERLSNLK